MTSVAGDSVAKPERHIEQLLAERIEDQAHSHWTEMAVIFAGANVLLALGLFGAGVTADIPPHVRALALAIACASTIASVLGYYSIRMGSTFAVGPVRLPEVLSSFFIAGAQIGLFAWPLHVLRSDAAASKQVEELRWWLAIAGIFCVAAIAASVAAAWLRRRRSIGEVWTTKAFESAQRDDWKFAMITAGACTVAFGLTFWFPGVVFEITLGAVLVVSALFAMGVLAQGRTAKVVARSRPVSVETAGT